MDPLKAYQNELGEAKARAAQFRADLSQEERRNSLASDDIRYSTETGGPGMPLKHVICTHLTSTNHEQISGRQRVQKGITTQEGRKMAKQKIKSIKAKPI